MRARASSAQEQAQLESGSRWQSPHSHSSRSNSCFSSGVRIVTVPACSELEPSDCACARMGNSTVSSNASPDRSELIAHVQRATATERMTHQINAVIIDVEFLADHLKNIQRVFLAEFRDLG